MKDTVRFDVDPQTEETTYTMPVEGPHAHGTLPELEPLILGSWNLINPHARPHQSGPQSDKSPTPGVPFQSELPGFKSTCDSSPPSCLVAPQYCPLHRPHCPGASLRFDSPTLDCGCLDRGCDRVLAEMDSQIEPLIDEVTRRHPLTADGRQFVAFWNYVREQRTGNTPIAS